MAKLDVKDENKYEKVATDEKATLEIQDAPQKYGCGIRHLQSLVIFTSLTVLFIARAHLSVTLVAMTDLTRTHKLVVEDRIKNSTSENNSTHNLSNYTNEEFRNVNNDTNFNSGFSDGENTTMQLANDTELNSTVNSSNSWNIYKTYEWPKSTQEMVLGSFFLGYMIMMSPMGLVAQRFGGKLCLQIGLFASAIITFATPWLAAWGDYKAVSASRVALGLLQSGTYPSLHNLVARWVPPSERGRLGTYIYTGAQIGSILSYHLSGFLVSSRFGWPSVFWVVGVVCLVTAIALTILVTPSPQVHPRISPEEKQFITGSSKEGVQKRIPTPWKSILTSVPVWGTFTSHVGGYVCYLFFFQQVPSYMHYIVGFNIKSSGLLSSLPYLANFAFSVFIGNLADHLINKKTLTTRQVRIYSTHIANLGPALCLLAVSFTTSPIVSVALLIICMASYGGVHTGWMISYIDMSPNFSSTLMATGNTLSNIFGLFVPALISYIVTDVTNIYQWRIILCIVAFFAIIGDVIYAIFVSADVQPWNDPLKGDKDPESENIILEKKLSIK